jgi:hypothetical protein
MNQPCPICHKYLETFKNEKIVCGNCKSILQSDNSDNLAIVESGVQFNYLNFLFVLLMTGIFIAAFVMLFIKKIEIYQAGLIMVLPFLAGLIRNLLYHLNHYYYLGLIGLYDAVIEKKIKYFDIASRILAVLIIIVPAIGILMIVFGLLIKL